MQKSWADPGGVQGVQTPALLIRVPFFEKNSVNKYHRECIKTHHFDIRNTKAPSPDPTPKILDPPQKMVYVIMLYFLSFLFCFSSCV